MPKKKSTLPHAAFFALFFLLISGPALCWLSGRYPSPMPVPLENRKTVTRPIQRELWNPDAWNAYITDNIPFRSQMLTGYLYLFENQLHSFKRAYVKGADGHIFAAAGVAPEVQIQLGIAKRIEYVTVRAHAALLSRQA